MTPGKKAAAAGVIALGLVLSGCATDGDGPRMGGVAAEVEGDTIGIGEVDLLTDALCVTNEATGDTRYTRPRSSMADDALGGLLRIAIVDELGLAQDATATYDPDQVPGWADMTNDEQRQLQEFLHGDTRLRAALDELGDPDAASPEESAQAALAELAERAQAEGIDVTVNPRFGVAFVDGEVTGARELSTPVSDEATRGEEIDLQYLDSLPDAQLCGVRPDADVAG